MPTSVTRQAVFGQGGIIHSHNALTFSVIIPTLNEEQSVAAAIRQVRRLHPSAQIIVVDGGSRDATVAEARALSAQVLCGPCGRGRQCNLGAAQATGSLLLFLHADTRLPDNAFEILRRRFANPAVKIGTFRLSFDHPGLLLSLYAAFARFDSIFTRFGDQCIVVRKSFLQELGGFPEWPLFEDVHLLRMARRRTRIHSFPAAVVTSARRFQQLGAVRTQLLNGWLVALYLLGTSPEVLARKYQDALQRRRGKAAPPLTVEEHSDMQAHPGPAKYSDLPR